MNHSIITRSAFDGLSAADREVWSGHDQRVAREYCGWPDQYFGVEKYPEIAPYQLVIDGLQFHYPPASHPRHHWRMTETEQGVLCEPIPEPPNLNWRFMREGFTHYLTVIAQDIAANRMEDAAKRLGILLHVFQDTHELHALEGPWGVDFFALDRLIEMPPDDRQLTPTALLALNRKTDPVDLSQYRPRLEGESVGEATLRLYRRYVQAAMDNRLLHVPIAQALMADDKLAAQSRFDRIGRTCAELSADVIHTVTALATGRFDSDEREALRQLPLDPIWAVQRPWNARGPYRFSAIVPNACLDRNLLRHPLRLRRPDRSSEFVERGWGSGAHYVMAVVYEIPEGVYRRLTATIGLHELLGAMGCVDVEVLHQEQTILRQRLERQSPNLKIDLPMDRGGEVRFIVREVPGSDPNANNLVWADPLLDKD